MEYFIILKAMKNWTNSLDQTRVMGRDLFKTKRKS